MTGDFLDDLEEGCLVEGSSYLVMVVDNRSGLWEVRSNFEGYDICADDELRDEVVGVLDDVLGTEFEDGDEDDEGDEWKGKSPV
jgi:hypothetical protein